MPKIKGVDVLIKVEDSAMPGTYVAVGGQRGATINRSAEAIDTTTKDSSGWKENEYGMKEWGLDCDGLLIESDAAYVDLEDAFMNGTKVKVELSLPGGTKYSGTALVTDFPIELPYDDTVTYSVALQGDGALVKA